jgi:ABC-type glutathione transport system ATPase component
MGLLRQLNKEQGITLIVVTHDPDVAAYADRTIRLKDGEVVEDSQQLTENSEQLTDKGQSPISNLQSPATTGRLPLAEVPAPPSAIWGGDRCAMY